MALSNLGKTCQEWLLSPTDTYPNGPVLKLYHMLADSARTKKQLLDMEWVHRMKISTPCTAHVIGAAGRLRAVCCEYLLPRRLRAVAGRFVSPSPRPLSYACNRKVCYWMVGAHLLCSDFGWGTVVAVILPCLRSKFGDATRTKQQSRQSLSTLDDRPR